METIATCKLQCTPVKVLINWPHNDVIRQCTYTLAPELAPASTPADPHSHLP